MHLCSPLDTLSCDFVKTRDECLLDFFWAGSTAGFMLEAVEVWKEDDRGTPDVKVVVSSSEVVVVSLRFIEA